MEYIILKKRGIRRGGNVAAVTVVVQQTVDVYYVWSS